MKKIISASLLSFLLVAECNAERDVSSVIDKGGLAYAHDENNYAHYETKPFTGKVERHYPNGKKK
jgi:hypothetical protein